jgi:hypothetical protein
VFLFDRSLSNTCAGGHSAGSTDALKRSDLKISFYATPNFFTILWQREIVNKMRSSGKRILFEIYNNQFGVSFGILGTFRKDVIVYRGCGKEIEVHNQSKVRLFTINSIRNPIISSICFFSKIFTWAQKTVAVSISI